MNFSQRGTTEEIADEDLFPLTETSKSQVKRELKNSRTSKLWTKKHGLRLKFKGLDIYGQKIQLTYKGKNSFKTTPGAIVSLLVLMTMTAFLSSKLLILFNKSNPNVSKQNYIMDLDKAPVVNPQDYGFEFAFGLNKSFDSTIGSLNVNQVSFNYEMLPNGTKIRPKFRTKIELEDCGLNHFRGFDNKTLLDMYGIP